MSTTHLEAALVDRLRKNTVRVPPYPAVAAGSRERAGSAQVNLAIAAALGRVAIANGPLSALRRNAWRCALLSARIAQELAPGRGIPPHDAYLAGLLHDFGAIVLLTTLEDIGRSDPLPALPETTWNALVARLHVDFGLLAAARWNLPEALVDVIEHHHEPTTPLAELIDLADLVVDVLDHPPSTSPPELGGLTGEERARINAAIPEVVEQMACSAPPTTQLLPILVDAVEGERAWPVAFEVQLHTGWCRASSLSPSSVTFTCTQRLAPNWLTELTIHCAPAPIAMLANVKRCAKTASGAFIVTAQPYALGGAAKDAWFALIEQTRRAGNLSIVGTRDDLPRLAL